MTPDQQFEIGKSLGIAAPLVIVLLYLLRLLVDLLTRATDERKTITTQFIDAMKTSATTSAIAQQQAAASLQELAATFRENASRSMDEHNRIVDALGKLSIRERA